MSHPIYARDVRRVAAPSEPRPDPAPPTRPAPGGIPEPEPGPFQDMPGWIWRAYLSAWAMLFGLFLVFFTTNTSATFMVIIASFFGAMAFGLPLALVAQKPTGCTRTKIIDTHCGPMSAGAAAAQIVLIPVGAVLGLVAFILLAM